MRKIVALILLLHLSCWYSFTEEKRTGKSLYVKPFENQTTEPAISQIISKEIVDELSSIFVFKPENIADYTIEGTIFEIKETPFTYTAQEIPKEIKITINCRVTITNKKTNERIEKTIDGWGTYSVESGSRQDGIKGAIDLLTQKICDIVRALP